MHRFARCPLPLHSVFPHALLYYRDATCLLLTGPASMKWSLPRYAGGWCSWTGPGHGQGTCHKPMPYGRMHEQMPYGRMHEHMPNCTTLSTMLAPPWCHLLGAPGVM